MDEHIQLKKQDLKDIRLHFLELELKSMQEIIDKTFTVEKNSFYSELTTLPMQKLEKR